MAGLDNPLKVNINRRLVTIDWKWDGVGGSDKTWIYDGKNHKPIASFKDETSRDQTVPESLIHLLDYKSLDEVENVDVYTAVIYKEEFELEYDNYELAEDSSDTLTIQRKSVRIVWDWAGTGGQPSIKYDGAEHNPSATMEDVIEGEETAIPSELISITLNGASIDTVKGVGEYLASISLEAFENEFGNYTVVEVSDSGEQAGD